jgi:hypothetical protein
MKLASYAVNGRKTFGIHSEGGLIDLGQRLAGRYVDMKDLLARGDLDKARAFSRRAGPLRDGSLLSTDH